MCGRVRLSSDVSEIKLVFSVPPIGPHRTSRPVGTLRPLTNCRSFRFDAKAVERSLDLACRGLVPYWAKDIKLGFANINAKAEGIENRPAFREAFQRRPARCRVDNFYEWAATGKRPYAVALADRGLMALAGL